MASRSSPLKYLPIAVACLVALAWGLRDRWSIPAHSRAAVTSPIPKSPSQPPPLLDATSLDAGAASPQDPVSDSKVRTGVDASDFYKNAFVLCAALTEEEKKMLKNLKEEVDADAAAALFEKIQPIMDLLRQAAAADFCDWGLGPLSFDTPMPQISKSAELGRLALWEAAYRFKTDPAGALDDLSVRAALGHHIADTLIGLLIQVSFERTATDWIRTQSPAMDATISDRAAGFLSESTVEANLTRAFSAELAAVSEMAKRLSAGDEEAQRLLAALVPINGTEDGPRQEIERILRDPQQLNAEFDYLQRIESQMAEAMSWPEARFQAWWKNVQAEMQEHPLAAMTLPSLTGVQSKIQQTRIERQMLATGLAIQQGGPAQIAFFNDPVTGAPFSYIPQAGGFELHSTWQAKGKPVTMHFATAQ